MKCWKCHKKHFAATYLHKLNADIVSRAGAFLVLGCFHFYKLCEIFDGVRENLQGGDAAILNSSTDMDIKHEEQHGLV